MAEKLEAHRVPVRYQVRFRYFGHDPPYAGGTDYVTVADALTRSGFQGPVVDAQPSAVDPRDRARHASPAA